MGNCEKKTLKLTNLQIEMLLAPTPIGIAFKGILGDAKGWTKKQPEAYYWLNRFADRMNSVIQTYLKMKNQYLEEHGIKGEDGKLLMAGKHVALDDSDFFKKPTEFAEKMSKIQSIEEDIGFYPIKIDWSNIPELENPLQMQVLMMLCEPDKKLEVDSKQANDSNAIDLSL